MLKRKSKQMLSIVLAVCMILPTVTAGVFTGSAAETGAAPVAAEVKPASAVGDDPQPSKPPAYDPDSATVGQFTEDQLDTSILVRHTGKTSQIMEDTNYVRELVDPNNYATSEEYSEYFHTTSASAEVYGALGLSYEQLQSNAKDYAADPNCQDPLSGYSYINPNELLIGDCNRNNDFDTYLHTCNDVESMDDIQSNNFDNLAKNTDDVFFHDDDNNWNTAYSNAIGIDVDGDGTDELAYYSLQQKETDSDNMHPGTYIRVQLYDRVPGSSNNYVWSKIDEYHMIMSYSDYLYRNLIECESKAFLSLAAGDYDGDGNEELAYYMPDKGGDSDAQDARVIIEKFNLTDGQCSHSELASFYLKNICSDYGEMGNGLCLPIVALSTTSTRLGNVVNTDPNTCSAKRYETFDDLVVSVSVPETYEGSALNTDSATAIFGKKDGSYQKLFQHEYEEFTIADDPENCKRRMHGVNTCDADLNGDGFKEIFVAGYCYIKDECLDPTISCANIITYDYQNGCYDMVWTNDMTIDQSKQEHGAFALRNYRVFPPVSLCAGHFLPGKLDLKDQVYINGFVYDLKNTKISGKPLYYSYNISGVKTNYVADTLPGCDKLNFPAGEVILEEKYYYDLSSLLTTDFSWYDSCASGRFITGSELDQIAVITWDFVKTYCWDISILSYSADDEAWVVKSHNDYQLTGEGDSDRHGSSLFVHFIDSEPDTAVYRWIGTYCSYSAPALYSILQVPPYYEEANGIYAYDFSLIVGNTEDSAVEWSAGIAVDLDIGGGNKHVQLQGSVGADVRHVSNKTWSHDRTLTRSLDIESEEDCAVCYVTPLVINVYEVYHTRPSDEALAASDAACESGDEAGILEHEIVQYSMMEEPIFTAIPISEYNKAAELQTGDDLPDENKLKPIDDTILLNTVCGDPTAYDHSLEDAIGQSSFDSGSTTAGDMTVNVYNNNNIALVGTEIEFGYGTTTEAGGTVDAHLGFHLGVDAGYFKGDLNGNLVGEYGSTSGTGSMDGVSFGTTYYPPRADQQLLGSLTFDDRFDTYDNSDAVINHYQPETGDWYNYDATSICYKTDYSGGSKVGIYSHCFYTDFPGIVGTLGDYSDPSDLNYALPPEQPKDFAIQSVRKHDDGSLDVTLIWDTANRNQTRKPDGYNIYMDDANQNWQGYIHLQNTDEIIVANHNSHFTTYTVHLGANDYRTENLNFYLAPAYYKPGNIDTVLEGTISKKATITSVEDINKNIIITKQPETCWLTDNGSSETATFGIEAQLADDFHPANGDVTFTWKKRSPLTDKWVKIAEETLREADDDGRYRSSCSIAVDGDKKESFKDTGIICTIQCGNSEQRSDIVSIGLLDTATVHTATSWKELQQKIDLARAGNTIKLSKDCTALVSDTALVIPEGKPLTLDLNGCTLNRDLADKSAAANGNVITNNGILTVTGGGTITGGNNTASGGGILNNGKLTVRDITVKGNSAAVSGGGIFCSGGTFGISGSPVITGNTAGGAADDVFVNNGSTITVAGALTVNAKIGVRQSEPDGSAFTSGLNGKGTASNFISNDSDYTVQLNSIGEAVLHMEYKIGDATLDGIVNVKDVTAIQRHIAQLESLTGTALLAADVNGDGDVTIADATALQQYLAEYNVSYPIGQTV